MAANINMKKIDSGELFLADHGWLKSRFHFSFAEYYNPKNVHFGVLRVLNDDIVQPGTGFPEHPHENMEIISYIVEGELTHQDSMGNKRTLGRGDIQYMSAGTGLTHSEYNLGTEMLRFLQIWILPDSRGLQPNYGDHRFASEERENRLLPLVSGRTGGAPVQIYQDVNIYATETEKEVEFPLEENRQAYLVLIEGRAAVNGETLETRDALEIAGGGFTIRPEKKAHALIIEMARL